MLKKLLFLILLITVIAAGTLSADGDETVDLLKSPDILANGGSYTSTFAPMAGIMNPAASALQQRLGFNINFASLFADAASSDYDGTAFNIGAVMPFRFGVITATGYLLGTDPVAELSAGFQGGLNGSFSKELYPGLLVGLGLNTYFGESWALTADLGFIKDNGDTGFMKNMKWGIVLGELGYSGFNNFNAPSAFTPGGGIGFDLIETENISLHIDSGLSFPFNSNNKLFNARLNLGGDVKIFDFAGISFSSTMDVAELIDGDTSALIPSFGIYFNFKTNFQDNSFSERGWSNNDIRTSVSAAPMQNGLWAVSAGVNMELGVIDKSAPEIFLDLSDFLNNNAVEDENGNDQETDNPSEDQPENKPKETAMKGLTVKTKKLTADSGGKTNGKLKNPGIINNGPNGEPIITYISPNNDGIKDSVEIPVSIKDSRYIKGFSFIVEDENGNEIKRIENKEKRPENLGLKNFFERLFYVEKGVDIPEFIRWDGIGDNGQVSPDGFYLFFMQAWDDNGNISSTDKYGLVIDNTPPSVEIVEVSAEERIFSPNNDGNKDSLAISQTGSKEDQWNAVIKSADGKIYKRYKWTNSSPESFVWDGKDDRKLLVPDGVYFYYIDTTDRAGNSIETELANIIINTQSTPISLAVDASYFAPGVSGARNKVNFIPDVPVKTGISSWSLRIVDEKGSTVKTYNTGKIPAAFEYDGSQGGNFINEGTYKGILNISYVNGNNPSAESPVIEADKTAPSASAKVSLRVFSPNGDGNKDTVSIYQETSVEDVWYAEITDAAGKAVRNYKWVINAEASFNWDGYTEAGKLAADGEYFYRLYTADRAGNSGESQKVSFTLDTEETPVILTAHPEAFSPNGDKKNETMTITPVLNVTAGIQSYKLIIADNAGTIVKTIKSEGRIKNEFIWDGFSDSGRKAPDGIYRAALEVVYEKGDISNAVTRDFILDTVYPEITISTAYTLFSPDDDGNKDAITISQVTSNEKLITGVIKNEKGSTIREFFWENNAADLVWDGTDSNGNKAEDGTYVYSIRIEDKAGNSTEKVIDRIVIDKRQASVFVTAGAKGFTPNGDGSNDKMEFSTIATLKEGVENWQLNIKQNGAAVIKTFSGTILPEKIIWDGKDDRGRVIEGNFKAEYAVNYLKGNRPSSITKDFTIDISPPEASVSALPVPFSPDNDGVDDELKIEISVKDQSHIKSWSFDIVDREGNAFTSFSGVGSPSDKIIWDGLSSSGELVIAAEDYPYRLTVTDEYDNKTQTYGIIPVDVLVVKDGDKLKIRIANITFAPDSAQLRKDDPAIKEKNEYVLGRLSEILKKYESYKILIEGHAVSVFWADPVKASKEQAEELLPLSKARAETVKNYLVQLGISANRMSTEGIGGKVPIVPHGDLDNRWKNRRVEFILIK